MIDCSQIVITKEYGTGVELYKQRFGISMLRKQALEHLHLHRIVHRDVKDGEKIKGWNSTPPGWW